MDAPLLIKLGGSLITDKTRRQTVRPLVLRRLAEELATALAKNPQPVILGHGSGSFGHTEAKAWGLSAGLTASDRRPGVGHTQLAVRELGQRVLKALLDAGLAPCILPPSAFMTAKAGRPGRVHADPVLRALDAGLIPVVGGDVLMDGMQGVAIASTEAVFASLIAPLTKASRAPSRALWFGETDGVYDGRGRTVKEITEATWPALSRAVVGASGTDVTGGMTLRVMTCLSLAKRGVESVILNGTRDGVLLRAVSGKSTPRATFVR